MRRPSSLSSVVSAALWSWASLRNLLGATFIGLAATGAEANDFGMPIKDFAGHMSASFKTIQDPTKITLTSCYEGGTESRTKCIYKLDDYMVAWVSGEPGAAQLSEVTLIATINTEADAAKCFLAYSVAMDAVVPDVSKEDRGRIIKFLSDGLKLGTAAELAVGGRRYIYSKVHYSDVVTSLWFHIEANE